MQLLITACLRLVYTIQIFIQLLIYKGKNEREITDFFSAVQIHSSHLLVSENYFHSILELHSD